MVWRRSGLVFFNDLFIEDNSLPKSHYFRCLQVRSFASKSFSCYPNPPPKDLSYSVFNVNSYNKGTVSQIYNLIQNRKPYTRDKTKTAREMDIEGTIPEEVWENIILRIDFTSFCFKIVHRLHYSNDNFWTSVFHCQKWVVLRTGKCFLTSIKI